MKIKEIENYLEKESKNGNVLAIYYVEFLKDATQPVKEFWYEYLGNLLDRSRKT